MFSKKQIKKFLLGTVLCASVTIFGALNEQSNASSSSYEHGKHLKKHSNNTQITHHKEKCKHKHHKHKKCHTHHKIKQQEINFYKKSYFGFGAGLGLDVTNQDTIGFGKIALEKFDLNPNSSAISPAEVDYAAFDFKPKFDNSFNGFIDYGYFINNKLGIGIELGYENFRNKQENRSSGYIETKTASAILKADYFLTTSKFIAPYISIGGGLAHTNSKGTLVNESLAITEPDLSVNNISLKFQDLIKYVGIFKIGAGISKTFNSSIIGLGYQFTGTTKIQDSSDSSFSDLKVNFQDGVLKNSGDFKFDDISHKNHTISFFVKKVI